MMRARRLIIFIDSGDTIVDEGTEIKDENDVVLTASCIPGAVEALYTLHDEGFTLAMVADGLIQSIETVYTALDLKKLFSAMVYSETVGVCKPDRRMFDTATKALGLTEADKKCIIMVGNNLERDIKGANLAGLISVHLDWSPRYRKVPASDDEIPRYVIHTPLELCTLARMLNERLVHAEGIS